MSHPAFEALRAVSARWRERGYGRGYTEASHADELDAALDALPSPPDGWQPIATAPKDNKSVLLYVPLDNGSNPQMTIVRGFFAAAGTVDMDTDDEDCVNEEGHNADDAWFSESGDREPYAMLLNYEPTHWRLLPSPPQPQRDER